MKRAVLYLALLSACDGRELERPPEAGGSRPTDAARPAAPLPADVRPTPAHPARFAGIGRAANPEEIRAWDRDVNPAGVGLPPGRGTYARGSRVYAEQCASCHGPRGEGIAPNPALVGTEPRDFSFFRDAKVPKTIGNYWPYATTLYDYINRAMPFAAPGSLPADDVYALVAYLLAENGIVDRSAVMDATTLPKVDMPARKRFVTDDRAGGSVFR